MEDQIHLEVVTPEQAVLTEDVQAVVLPGENGELGVLPGHLPLLTSLGIGEMVVQTEDGKKKYFLGRGFAEILPDTVRVLARDCEGVDEIDVEKARAEIEEAEAEVARLEERAAEIEEADEAEEQEELLEKYRESLKKARTRLMLSDEMSDEL